LAPGDHINQKNQAPAGTAAEALAAPLAEQHAADPAMDHPQAPAVSAPGLEAAAEDGVAAAGQSKGDIVAAPAEAEAAPASRAARAAKAVGDEDDDATDSDVEAPPAGRLPVVAPPPPLPPLPRPPSGAKGRKGGGRGGGITLKLLIDEGILEPGVDILTMEYKGTNQTATLDADGRIVTELRGKQLVFESPSAFSIYFKRLLNPTRKADDGWKTVKYQGRLLEQFKGELARKHLGDLPTEGGASSGSFILEPGAKRARLGAAPPGPSMLRFARADASGGDAWD
jgi:hypothetical protein